MHFAPDTEETLEFTVALANTVATATKSGTDELSTPAQLTDLLTAHRYSGRFDRDESELMAVRHARDRLRGIWMLDRDTAVNEVNAMLAESRAMPFLVRHDDFDWHLHATSPEAPLEERIMAEVALALVDVIRTDEYERLRACGADDCEGLLADLSRNGSKRFCSVRCGNRMNMVAFRERRG
ncbi:CGNR zinc finger domain-containing protein [Subtercola sp. PAMC28395]|uniref:CGNR zinc finger domain-containing protein n=1 Tax=Subtercola sp. PAMC28395 TaxID=2846775 RepID=UPI001C0DE5A6|nr:CGNR zinc finger domain-containing protein [Subtercola sp. PAMC28395]QWT24516.1 CGNR zinc finger domain-containing protein [Subtercola sp. PAMC28395]